MSQHARQFFGNASIPEPMSDTESLQQYLVYFERWVVLNRLEDEHAASLLATMIPRDSNEASWFESLSDKAKSSYAAIKREVDQREDPQAASMLLELFTLRYDSNDVDSYRQRVERLIGVV